MTGATLSLRKNFSWALVGNVAVAASQLLTVSLISKLGSTELLGLYALAMAICIPIMQFSNLKLRAVLASDAAGEFAFSEYAYLRSWTTAIAAVVIISIAVFGLSGEAGFVLLGVGVLKTVDSFTDICYGRLQQAELMNIIAKSQVIRAVGAASVTAATLALGGHLASALFASGVLSFIIFWFYDFRSVAEPTAFMRQIFASESFRTVRHLAWIALPLGLTVMLGSLSSSIPRWSLSYFQSVGDLGLFAGVVSLASAGNLIIAALGQSATPRLAKYYSERDHTQFKRLLNRLVLLGAALGITGTVVAILIGDQLLRLAFNNDFRNAGNLLVWMSVQLAFGYVYVFLGTACTALRLFKVQLPIHILSTIVLALGCLIFVPNYGAVGAVWALLTASLLECGVYVVVVRRELSHVMVNLEGSIG